jgi:hypothetical protein
MVAGVQKPLFRAAREVALVQHRSSEFQGAHKQSADSGQHLVSPPSKKKAQL